eukprot:312789_1
MDLLRSIDSFNHKAPVIHDAHVNIKTNLNIVIGAGLGRTGTSSIQAGLHALGYKCYHMREAMNKDNGRIHSQLWLFLYKQKLKLKKENNITSFKDWNLITLNMDKYCSYFEQILNKNGYNASVDWPSCMFYLELIEYYKRKGINYKILLSVRDSAEQWWESYSNTIGKVPEVADTWFWRLMPGVEDARKVAQIAFVLPFGEDTRMDKEHVMKQYLSWIESVKQFVNEDKLLIFNVKQGWYPLIKFLELEIPHKYKDKP